MRGQIYQVNGNEPILLNDPSVVWVVESGSMALFAVTLCDGAIEGTRRYLYSISPGEALFGTAGHGRQILAVPIGETKLLLLNQEYLRDLIANGDGGAKDLPY
jgi:hypothetical protein